MNPSAVRLTLFRHARGTQAIPHFSLPEDRRGGSRRRRAQEQDLRHLHQDNHNWLSHLEQLSILSPP